MCENHGSEKAYLFPIVAEFSLSRTNICAEKSFKNKYSISERDLRELTARIIAYFNADIPGVSVVEVMFTFYGFFHIFLSDEVNIGKVSEAFPRRVADCFVYYNNISDLRHPDSMQQMARRDITPQPTAAIIDDTEYSVFRPGVLVCSEMRTGTARSTLGVLVKDDNGNGYVTAASHRMADNGIVMTPKTGRIVGTVSADIPRTDIALVDLNKDVEFENQPFETAPDIPSSFTRLATEDDDLTHDTCFLDSPFSGVLEGVVAGTSIRVEGTEHIGYIWQYYGQLQGRICPPDGTCGAPICNENGVVSDGNFSGLSASVSASGLKHANFELSL
ncbi:hypothetical protein CMQ_5599 [Grosmannia clavigera kw1407]|uniref:Uncharacterized protein n=1 Tax=Grosmannia clavigera (strain kw1407 / UAMH 11150) TaxID=655863 RepID=F0XSZ4_GROCL|nr:uncharacterized protein CMQ_5599 [Grosmannia clavigera kw1407]EFW99178.1 hypothetical protein CMQ_5599 [Grosmannia clavigera kw1407]